MSGQITEITGRISNKAFIVGKIGKTGGGSGSGDHFIKKYSLKATRQKSITYIKKITDTVQVLTDEQKNISNWNKNMSFPQFDNVYADGCNNLLYQGGSGYERIYIAVNTKVGRDYSFEFDFKSPTGFSCSYESDVDYAFVTNNSSVVTNSSGGFNTSDATVYSVFDKTASDTTKHYKMEFTATSDTTYLCFDFGYIVDGVTVNLYFADLNLYMTSYEYKKEETE